MNPLPRLYNDLAWLWPALSPPEHYETEAHYLAQQLHERLGPGPLRLLELGAGGGHTLVHLDARSGRGGVHHTTAVDLSPAMLTHSRALIPGLETHVADMRTVRLGETFDAVLLHDAVDYLLTPEDVQQTLATVHEHLRPGGVAFIAPTYTAETFIDGDTAEDAVETPSHAVTYFSFIHDPDPTDTTFEMVLLYLLRPRDEQGQPGRAELIEDRHRCGLLDENTWQALVEAAGLTCEHVHPEDEDGDWAWSLFVATKAD